MAASQAELQRQLNTINARLAAIQARLDRATRGTPQTRELSREKKQLEEEKNKVTQQLNSLTTIKPIVSGGGGDFGGGGAGGSGWVGEEPVPTVGKPNPFPSVPAPPPQTNQGIVQATRAQETTRENFNVEINNDWRVRLYLAPLSTYLYNDLNNQILSPLRQTNGVIFPYTPQIQVTHTANYDAQEITHSNYKLYFYKNSSVENIQIMGDFTAQDTNEANYLLAVIHFFKSVTKMFYGKDENAINGTPPPICYLDGFGTYQFNKHPLLISNFSYTLPTDVDYIRATTNPTVPSGLPNTTQTDQGKDTDGRLILEDRLNGIKPGGGLPQPQWRMQENRVPTYVPTKMQITLNAYPVISRKDISDNFSLQAYANGSLLLGKSNKNIGAGIW